MIVIGVDMHKRSHTLVALDAATGVTCGQLTIPASEEGTLEALRFAGELDTDRMWAIEDPDTCRQYSIANIRSASSPRAHSNSASNPPRRCGTVSSPTT